MCKDSGMELLRLKGWYMAGLEVGDRRILSDLGTVSWALVEVVPPPRLEAHNPEVVWVKDIDRSHLQEGIAESHKQREKKREESYGVHYSNLYSSLEAIEMRHERMRLWWAGHSLEEIKVALELLPNPEW